MYLLRRLHLTILPDGTPIIQIPDGEHDDSLHVALVYGATNNLGIAQHEVQIFIQTKPTTEVP